MRTLEKKTVLRPVMGPPTFEPLAVSWEMTKFFNCLGVPHRWVQGPGRPADGFHGRNVILPTVHAYGQFKKGTALVTLAPRKRLGMHALKAAREEYEDRMGLTIVQFSGGLCPPTFSEVRDWPDRVAFAMCPNCRAIAVINQPFAWRPCPECHHFLSTDHPALKNAFEFTRTTTY